MKPTTLFLVSVLLFLFTSPSLSTSIPTVDDDIVLDDIGNPLLKDVDYIISPPVSGPSRPIGGTVKLATPLNNQTCEADVVQDPFELYIGTPFTFTPVNHSEEFVKLGEHRADRDDHSDLSTLDPLAPGVVKPEIGENVNFEIKSQFMRELRDDTFFGNKNDDAHEHVKRVLDIVGLFNIPDVSYDAVMLRVFPITLTGEAKRWVDRLQPGTINSWELLKNAFIQRYCPPSKTAKQLEEIQNFKQDGGETLYQAWEHYNDLLYKCPTHDINNHQKVNIFYNGLGAMNRQLLNSQGPIPGMTPNQAFTTIQTMADHSQKWHDISLNKTSNNENNSAGIASLINKIENLGRDMKKLKENMHAIQVGCQLCKGAHLDKDYPLNEEVNSAEPVKYGEFIPPPPFGNNSKYRVGPPGYYTRIDNKQPFNEKKPNLEELMNKHLEKSARRRAKMEEWILPSNSLPCQLPPKEINPGNFTLPCTIGNLNVFALADLGASVNVIPKSVLEQLKLTRLTKTNMKVEMANTTKRTPLGIIKNLLVKIDKFLFPPDFVIMDMLNNRNETVILGRPFLATIHAEIDVFNKEISLRIDEDGTLKNWYFDGDMNKIEKDTVTFPEFLLIKYGETQDNGLVWDERFDEWCSENSNTYIINSTIVQEINKLRPKDYHFKDWLLTKVGHTNVSEPVKKNLLKTWLVDCFQNDLNSDPLSRSFDDYKYMFDLEIDLLADEYAIGIGKKGHILEDIWDDCK
ncbi:hypothetical protein Tco_1327779 [Tanacetum coccineum]